MNSQKPYRILLYYKYVRIENPKAYTELHLAFCRALGVKGRILIAGEGINGTISGTPEQTDAYMHAMHMDPRFADMVFKIDEAGDHVFRKIFVRHREEIVTMALEDDVDPNEVTGKHLDPEEFFRELQSDDVIIIDARNDYEYDLGHFRNAIRPNVRTFKEFPGWVRENLAGSKEKKILTYCTGGIRCEKFTGFLLKEGFSDVSQLHGGIISYANDPEVQGKMFDGRCYVFDERVSVPVNHAEGDALVSHCRHCGAPSDRYVNCANLDCDIQFFCCEACEHPHRRSCSDACTEAPRHEYTPEVGGEGYAFYRQ
jgi:UPF0176 protein